MNIGYIKIKKKRQAGKNSLTNIVENIKFIFYDITNRVENDKYNDKVFYITNFNDISLRKLRKKLNEKKIEYALVENGYSIGYPTLNGKNFIKNMIPEVVELCSKAIKPVIDEVYVCTNIFNQKNIAIIEELTSMVKVVNVVTNNQNYYKLERKLEEKDIFITVSSNRRKSLKKAYITINLDLKNFNEYNINRNMIIIDASESVAVPKSFNGIIIRRITIDTKKVLRVFSEFEDFDKQELIEVEMIKLADYNEIRKFIKSNRIYISGLYNIRKIDMKEFTRIREIQSKQHKKRTPLA